MDIAPDFDTIKPLFDKGKAQLLWCTLMADTETPVSIYQRVATDERYAFLLESVEKVAIKGRHSFIGYAPDLVWRYDHDGVAINANFANDPDDFVPQTQDTLQSLEELTQLCQIDTPPQLPAMASGLVGYLSFDAVRLSEPVLGQPKTPHAEEPMGLFIRPSVMLVFDNLRDEIAIVTPLRPDNETPFQQAYDNACGRIAIARERMGNDLPPPTVARQSTKPTIAHDSNMTPQAYMDMVGKAKSHILAGDIFQVVLSQRLSVPFSLPPFDFYRELRRINPSPYLFFLNFGDFAIAGSSPEILVQLRGETITIRPIAGTRPRGKTAEQDALLEKELLADEKECAEHLMLLDLGRNDVGRASQIGTVQVTREFFVEHYSHVMHIVSNVEGRIAKGLSAIQALMSGFPAGTVSGAPKIRAIQIIDELEPESRGIYSGCIGYFAGNGDMDTCIALRTGLIKNNRLYVQAGAGIVHDSVPEKEHAECLAKARALLVAAQSAQMRAQNKQN